VAVRCTGWTGAVLLGEVPRFARVDRAIHRIGGGRTRNTNEAGLIQINERVSTTGRVGIKATFDGATFLSAQGSGTCRTMVRFGDASDGQFRAMGRLK
jgi:hypothetical protein